MDKSRARRQALYAELEAKRLAPKTLPQLLNWLWIRHRAVFALDEAEHVTFGAIAVYSWLTSPHLWCWVFGVGQICIAIFRHIERGRQLVHPPETLTNPMRK